ncbi:hypothetical protein N7454_001502 [Penicillium verhagenii]|nr:hypothetical protein N7454_001502 [Penicillium verhagenii]
MPVPQYGVWKANPLSYHFEPAGTKTPHLELYFDDGVGSGRKSGPHSIQHHPRPRRNGPFRAAINIQSGDKKESRLAYWINTELDQHAIVKNLTDLEMGFHSLGKNNPGSSGTDLVGLDFIRSNLFEINSGRVLPHDIEGPNNDLIDVLQPEVEQAIEEHACIYLFGSQFNTRDGIHDVHMNQGNIPGFQKDDGVFQDGALVINYPQTGRWVGLFLAFASQAVHTDNSSGHAITTETWGDYLIPEGINADLTENSVKIKEVLVNTPGRQGRRRSVTLTNPTDHTMPLSSWKIHNSAGQSQELPADAALGALSTDAFEIPNVPLSNTGDTITLVNQQGLKVDGVSYSSKKEIAQGQSVVFAH